MSDQHTPEPWSYGEDNDGWYVEKDGNQLAYCLSEANTRRIVACVNACKGLSTEDLETLPPLQTALDEATLVEKQRDELLACLTKALRYIEVETAYKGAMTAAQVEEAIKSPFFPSSVEIGANSCNTLATFDFVEARAIIEKAKGAA